jgi:pyruvate,water dikinase
MAFEKVPSGYPSFDNAVDHIRMGDNVVFQVSRLKEYRFFVDAFVRQSKKDGRRLVYIRFATHEELVAPDDAYRYTLDPSEGFEVFATKVHNIISEEGRGVFYVFDCLSELQVAWAADLMMGNFFCVTCPFLFRLDTVAFFPVIRGAHSFEALARIRETTQLFLDIGSDAKNIYLHPIKVWNRYSATMFLPHRAAYQNCEFKAMTSSADSSRYYTAIASMMGSENQNLDSWERYFFKARTIADDDDEENGEIKGTIMRMMMSKDAYIRNLLNKYFTVKDYFAIKDKMIGSGRIGGKACGMLLARKIVSKKLPEISERMEPHDSYYIGDHVFYTYLVHNGLWDLHVRQKSDEGYFSLAGEIAEGIKNGIFPENINMQFRRMLEYFGQAPIIARSSSLLEDGFGNAFAGKYESVFCANQGDIEQRLKNLQEAIKTVYASTVDASALEYREKMGLRQRDEQMSILVQRVSGSFHDGYFHPSASGVGYSFDIYGLHDDIDPKKGMLRMVLGLGTRAVDRTGTDYPRIIHLDRPEHTYLGDMNELVRFSQRKADVVDLRGNRLVTVDIQRLKDGTECWYHELAMERDAETERRCLERGETREVYFGTDTGRFAGGI